MPCAICGDVDDAQTHETNQHSEDWVNLADARYTGEMIFMPAGELLYALDDVLDLSTADEQWMHVDRRIIEAFVAVIEEDPDIADDKLAGMCWLRQRLENNPRRSSPEQRPTKLNQLVRSLSHPEVGVLKVMYVEPEATDHFTNGYKDPDLQIITVSTLDGRTTLQGGESSLDDWDAKDLIVVDE